jgi:hypothetical protein
VSCEVVFVLLLVVFESHPVTQTQDTTVYIHMSIHRLGATGIGGRSPVFLRRWTFGSAPFGAVSKRNVADFYTYSGLPFAPILVHNVAFMKLVGGAPSLAARLEWHPSRRRYRKLWTLLRFFVLITNLIS